MFSLSRKVPIRQQVVVACLCDKPFCLVYWISWHVSTTQLKDKFRRRFPCVICRIFVKISAQQNFSLWQVSFIVGRTANVSSPCHKKKLVVRTWWPLFPRNLTSNLISCHYVTLLSNKSFYLFFSPQCPLLGMFCVQQPRVQGYGQFQWRFPLQDLLASFLA